MTADRGEPSPLTAAEIAEAKARCDAATPGPWSYQPREDNGRKMPGWINGDSGTWVADIPGVEMPNGYFIAHAREDLPRALATIESLERKLAALRNECEAGKSSDHKLERLWAHNIERIIESPREETKNG
jgi:hypothetical protein